MEQLSPWLGWTGLIEPALKTLQLVLMVLASFWAFWLTTKFSFVERVIALRLKQFQLKESELGLLLKQMDIESQSIQNSIQKRTFIESSKKNLKRPEVSCDFQPVARVQGNLHRWGGSFKIRLVNESEAAIDIHYSVLEFFIGKPNLDKLNADQFVVVNAPPTAFQRLEGTDERNEHRSDFIHWKRVASIGSTTPDALQSATGKKFFDDVNCDSLKTQDCLLVGTLIKGKDTILNQDFIFDAEPGEYLGIALVYGLDTNFIYDMYDEQTIGFFELKLPEDWDGD